MPSIPGSHSTTGASMGNTEQNLYGLVLAGGKSTRMGKDKAGIVYMDKPQLQVAYELLEQFCSKVFISSRKDQTIVPPCHLYPRIEDSPEYEGKGPLAGILSAMKLHPEPAWLVLACDLPFINVQTIENLLNHRHSGAIATAYRNHFDHLPEPLCAVWEKGYWGQIDRFFKHGVHCPRKVLLQSNAKLIELQSAHELDNINNPDEAIKAVEQIKTMQHKK